VFDGELSSFWGCCMDLFYFWIDVFVLDSGISSFWVCCFDLFNFEYASMDLFNLMLLKKYEIVCTKKPQFKKNDSWKYTKNLSITMHKFVWKKNKHFQPIKLNQTN
jgi:hypothetical protein